MKKVILIFLLAIALLSFIYIQPIRTNSSMLYLAKQELEDLEINDSLYQQLRGPLLVDCKDYITYEWYKPLPWGDSSKIHITIYKTLNKCSFRDPFFSPDVSMNLQWYYFVFPNGTSKFKDIVPPNTTNTDLSKFKLYKENPESDTFTFTKKPELLFYFLQKGFFTINEKKDNYVGIDFYEEIAKSKYNKQSTGSARVYIVDTFQLKILPVPNFEK